MFPRATRPLTRVAALLVVLAAAPWGQAAVPLRELSASLDNPASGFGWRDGTRGQLGVALPLLGEAAEVPRFEVLPAIELHNSASPESQIPNELWRGRVALAGWLPVGAGSKRRTELGLGLEHESDHETARWDAETEAFLSLNAVTLMSAYHYAFTGVRLWAETRLRLLVRSCTVLGACTGFDGSTASGGEANLSVDAASAWHGVVPFLSVSASGILGRGVVMDEARLVLNAGLWTQGSRGSHWQFFGTALIGNEVGLFRAERVHTLGAALRWTPKL
jgi:hypothetical protein